MRKKCRRYLLAFLQRPFTQFVLSYLAMAFAVGAVVCLIAIAFAGDRTP